MLRAGDVTLRPLTLRDLDDVVDACRDGEIVRFALLVPSPYTAEDGRRFLKQVESEWAQERADRVFAIVADGAFQGVISVNLGTGVVGYWMRREGRGRGWMTEALKLIVDWAESGGGVRPWLTTHPDNVASQRVAEKAGFQRIGLVDEPRGFRDGTMVAVRFELRAKQS